ncbi:MAG TPA: TonB-dependent receptor [Povalibacter sp.]|uniref:TonB-dependent receptor n=1 Tax=Povalibacter sp. TaxID=1962978 RepID=UPI002D0D3868|nr:TonB-dependent receptor [Povalibacter sp.]HMN44329.1 TonB-dependent receptor [Povalibacter sp.]
MTRSSFRRTTLRCGLFAGSALALTSVALAADDNEILDEVVVFARGEALIGKADASSEGAVGGADLSVRPLLRVAELLEVVPGLIAAQHSGSGKANQYFLRGFNLDHGTDFTTYIDGVPMNMRTHGHGQGYLDLNGLIAETVDRIDYRKGTYRANAGDFSMAGSAFMTTVNHIDPFLSAETGSHDWRRLAGGGSFDAGEGTFTFMGQLKTYDGPWQLPEDLRHESIWGKYARDTALGALELSVSGYHAEWDPTEQIPERAIGTNVCRDEFCALDPTAVGETLRWIGSAKLTGTDWRASAYAQYYDWHMLSNPTYDYQIDQFDRRWIAGGLYERNFEISSTLALTAGAELRYDDIGNVGLNHTEAGEFVEQIARHAVTEGSLGIYGEATWQPIEKLRVIGGLRGDYFDFDVKARMDGLDAGSADDSAASPKLGAAWTLTDTVEVYANWGKGFHSNDARGVVNTLTPVAGISKGEGQEAGLRYEHGSLRLSATYWWLDLDSELKFVGDSNSVEPGPGTERRGYELVGFWRPLDWLALDAVWTGSRARYVDSPGAEYVPGAVENAGEFGISAVRDLWEASLRVRYLGEYPLVEDDSLRADPETTVNLRGAWKPGKFVVYAELLNVFDSDGKDIVYYYESNVAGLDPPGEAVAGRMSRAVEPRTLRAGIKYRF